MWVLHTDVQKKSPIQLLVDNMVGKNLVVKSLRPSRGRRHNGQLSFRLAARICWTLVFAHKVCGIVYGRWGSLQRTMCRSNLGEEEEIVYQTI